MELVNGYVCRNCADVALAKRNIDPAHPKDGPGRIDASPPDAQKPKALLRPNLGQAVDLTA